MTPTIIIITVKAVLNMVKEMLDKIPDLQSAWSSVQVMLMPCYYRTDIGVQYRIQMIIFI